MAKKNEKVVSPMDALVERLAGSVGALLMAATERRIMETFGIDTGSPAGSPGGDKEEILRHYLSVSERYDEFVSLTASEFSSVKEMIITANTIGVWNEKNADGKLLSPGYVIRKKLDVPKGQEKPSLPAAWYALRRLEDAIRQRKHRKSGGGTGGGRDFGMTPKRAAIVALNLEKENNFAAGAAYALGYTFVQDCGEDGKPCQTWDSVYQDFLNDCAVKTFSIVDCVSLYNSGKEKEKEGKDLTKKEALVRKMFNSLFSKKK